MAEEVKLHEIAFGLLIGATVVGTIFVAKNAYAWFVMRGLEEKYEELCWSSE